jgi:hypothetical protein
MFWPGKRGLIKKDLATAGIREKRRALLRRDTLKTIAERIERELGVVEAELAVYKGKIEEIVRESELAPSLSSLFLRIPLIWH